MRKSKPGTYTFNTWGDASKFCQKNELPKKPSVRKQKY